MADESYGARNESTLYFSVIRTVSTVPMLRLSGDTEIQSNGSISNVRLVTGLPISRCESLFIWEKIDRWGSERMVTLPGSKIQDSLLAQPLLIVARNEPRDTLLPLCAS